MNDREQVRLEKLKLWADLWDHPGFQDWIKGTQGEMAVFKELPWAIGIDAMQDHVEALKAVGMDPPRTKEALYDVFLAAKAVVHYTEERIKHVADKTTAYYKLLKKISEREGNQNG